MEYNDRFIVSQIILSSTLLKNVDNELLLPWRLCDVVTNKVAPAELVLYLSFVLSMSKVFFFSCTCFLLFAGSNNHLVVWMCQARCASTANECLLIRSLVGVLAMTMYRVASVPVSNKERG